MIRLVAAIDRKRGIAKHGVMPWNIPEDEKFFTDQTKSLGGHVLSGGATFREAYQNKPLADRHNYVLTRDTTPIPGVELVHDLKKFLDEFEPDDLWVAGGAQVFNEVIKLGKADVLYLTLIDADFGCDRFFADYASDFKLVEESEPKEQNGFHYKYTRWERAT
jgi:dihydrofolate reductase